MTATDIVPETQVKAQHTLLEETEDIKSSLDMDPKTEAFPELSNTQVPKDSGSQNHHQDAIEGQATGTKKSGPTVHPPPKTEYGVQWDWNAESKDYTRIIDGELVCYRDYQRIGGSTSSKSQNPPATPASSGPSQAKTEAQEGESSKKKPSSDSNGESSGSVEKDPEEDYVKVSRNPEADQSAAHSRQNSISVSKPVPTPKSLKEYEEPLDEGFTIVDKPKRFFQVGRIFATVWFEPGGENPPGRKPDLEWTKDCPKYHDEKPIAKFRWFVVVRKRLHHSLCFNITTIGPKGPRKADRGRGQDFVVLHNSNVEPPKPFEVEGITRDPIAVIIEAGEESISPWARIDCGRIYTVEDNLRVMKIGRVHTLSLPLLENYFKESVL